jgi:hypothetical protein
MFDYVLCAQTLEDVRDPVRVCAEMARVGRAGYVETPGAVVELTRGVDSPLWCGWMHHRWLVERNGGDGLVFLAKPHHIHSPLWPAVRSTRLLRKDASSLELEWRGGLPAAERILVDRDELDTALLAIIERDARQDALGSRLRRLAGGAWRAYRSARRLAGRAAAR